MTSARSRARANIARRRERMEGHNYKPRAARQINPKRCTCTAFHRCPNHEMSDT